MRILFTITGLAMGGAENQVVSLAAELDRRGHKITLAYMLEPAVVLPKSGKVKLIGLGGDKTVIGMARAYFNLVKIVKSEKPDVVHSHMFHANILSRFARLFAKIPRLVCTAHSNNEGGKMRMLAYRITDPLADVFTNVSEAAVEAFESRKAVPKGKMLTVHNGTDTNRFAFNAVSRKTLRKELGLGNKKVFIAIGRFHEAKDYPNLLAAFAILHNSFDNSHLLIVGDGEMRPQVERQLNKLELQESVSLLGIRKDVPALLSAADVFVLSSAWEGFPLVVGEAMAAERVVVTTDAGGAREFLLDDDYLVEVKNSQALAVAMEKALKLSEQEAHKLGQRARERVIASYSLQSTVDKWQRIYAPTLQL